MSENGMNEDMKKKVDEAWKDGVKKEKTDGPGPAAPEFPEVTFSLFLSGLMMEALVALGEIENPITKKKEVNKPHAKFLIDTIAMLKEKTKQNLAKDEADGLEAVLYELRMRFVNKTR